MNHGRKKPIRSGRGRDLDRARERRGGDRERARRDDDIERGRAAALSAIGASARGTLEATLGSGGDRRAVAVARDGSDDHAMKRALRRSASDERPAQHEHDEMDRQQRLREDAPRGARSGHGVAVAVLHTRLIARVRRYCLKRGSHRRGTR